MRTLVVGKRAPGEGKRDGGVELDQEVDATSGGEKVHRNAREYAGQAGPILGQQADAAAGEADNFSRASAAESHSLVARHACAVVCPKNVPILADSGKHNNNNNANVVYCCPARKTVTKTRTRTKSTVITKTSTLFKTATAFANKLSAIVFVDNNGGGTYQPGDTPQGGVQVDLVSLPARARCKRNEGRGGCGCNFVATATTNAQGLVNFEFPKQAGNAELCISQHGSCFPCLVSISVDENGLLPSNITSDTPLPIPLPPSSSTATTTNDGKSTTPGVPLTTAVAVASTTIRQPTTTAAPQTTAAAQTTAEPTSTTVEITTTLLTTTGAQTTAPVTTTPEITTTPLPTTTIETSSETQTTATATLTPMNAYFTTPGTFQWTAPPNVYAVHVACVGAGAGGAKNGVVTPSRLRERSEGSEGANDEDVEDDNSSAYLSHSQEEHKLEKRIANSYYVGTGGGGGGLGWQNNIPVVPGQNYTVVIGAGGAAATAYSTNGTAGGDSYFISTSTVAGFGGKPGIGGGHFPSGQGGDGGGAYVIAVTFITSTPTRRLGKRVPPAASSSGGGGAGGYTGDGGFGGAEGHAAATNGTGGAGGGGFGPSSGTWVTTSGSGGGINLAGLGTSGTAGNAVFSGGGGGSGGCSGLDGSAGGLQTVLGAGGGMKQQGGDGACHIVWGGDTSWPSNVLSVSANCPG